MKFIQVFTDGGIFRKGKYAISIGIIFINGKEVIKFEKITHNKDSDFAELFAINKALSRLYGHLKQHDMYDGDYEVYLYTDSLASIKGIQSSLENCNPDNSDRLMMLNEIRDTLGKYTNPVRFNHIKSHLSYSGLHASHKRYCEANICNISFDAFLFIYQQNSKCDRMVKKRFKKLNKQMIIESKK